MEKPRVCLIGAGKFGKEHLKEWQHLEILGRVELSAIVVNSPESKVQLQKELDIPVYDSLSVNLLSEIDLVDIATPAETHLDLLLMCAPHCHVLVEKPLVTSQEQLDRLLKGLGNNIKRIVVGHNYRFIPIIEKLKSLTDMKGEFPQLVEICMLNMGDENTRASPNLEFIHAFDLMDYLFGLDISISTTESLGCSNEISLRYGGGLNCVMNLGTHKRSTQRFLRITYSDISYYCDLLTNSLRTHSQDGMESFNFPHEKLSLGRQIQAFVNFAAGKGVNPLPIAKAETILKHALQASPVVRKRRPRVAIIGGGVFGTNIGLELNAFCDVDIFERHNNLLEEVSYANQWRHHSGFHYPRSYDTIQEIKVAKKDFESLYNDAIIRDRPSYFCPSASGIEIPAERYLAACSSNYLSFSFEYPPGDVLNRNMVSVSLKTDEGVYDFYKLRDIISERLESSGNINVYKNTSVIRAELLPDGAKRLTIESQGTSREEDYDYLICATYSNRNLLSRWLSFPIEPLRFDLYELLILRLDIPQLCVTIIDGPFTSLVGIGGDLFMLSHIHDSVLKSKVTKDGLPPDWGTYESNSHNMIASASKYLPVLRQAEYVESRYATRAVNASARDFDARPTVIRNHGFGCWSVLGGKIITCVTNARDIAKKVRQAQ